MVSVACSQRLKPSVFRHQHLTITRRKGSKNQHPRVSSTVSFIISSPLTVLFFLVQKVSLLDTHLLMQRRGADSSSGNIKMVFLWEQQSCLICRPTAPDRHLADDDAATSLPSRLLLLKEHEKPQGQLLSRRQPLSSYYFTADLIINAPGYQQALPPIIKKTRMTPGALLREEEEMFSVIYCTVPPVAAPHQIIPPPACASVQIFQGGWCKNIASIISRAGGVRCYVLFFVLTKTPHRRSGKVCAKHI